jgi:hypothetical protein
MKNGEPIALPCDTRPVGCAYERFREGVVRDTKYSRFCSHAILQQLQIREDLFSPEADIDMGNRISISSYPNNAMEV